jgi:peptidyl-prolyl cis-trans isomerase C
VKRNFIFCIILGLLFSGVTGCDKFSKASALSAKPAKTSLAVETLKVKGPLVAKVNNIPIGLDDFNKEVEVFNANLPADGSEVKITTREQKIEYLKNSIVRRTLLYQNALDKGIDRKEDISKALEKTKMQLLVMELINESAQKVDVSSKEIEDFYNANKDQLKEPEERQIQEIVVATEAEAKDMLIQLLQGGDFGVLAQEHSIAPSAKNNGELGFIKKGKKSSQFDNLAFADSLQVGKISSIFQVPEGYSIIKLESKRGGKQKMLSEMWEDIKKLITYSKQEQAIDDLIGKLSREAKIEIYEGEIK